MFAIDYVTNENLKKYEKDLSQSPVIFPYLDRWANYNSVINRDANEKQIASFTDTMLYNNADNDSIKFVYDEAISRYNELIEDAIKHVTVVDHKISLCNEVYFTSKIEGAHTTIARTIAIHDGAPIDPNNEQSERMIKNCFDATKFLNLHPHEKINEQMLLKTWSIVTDGVCQNQEIKGDKYRNGDVLVGPYEGPSYKNVDDLMKKWLIFYNSKRYDDYPFVKAALLHYSFETIHPFCDGNGRLGRMLMNHYLITHGYEQVKGISFSHTIDQSRVLYDAAFSLAENEWNDCTPFLEYMMDIYYRTIDDLELEHVIELENEDK